eukprot:TRINITY_DN17439_c0_g1_i1.p1 TRINITY_DN17439_c0_g1~~TRINITY_DN17439_c0_g1_i1.p1  ORF type:complete len:125 (-),score=43.83 TRINITY_DN17439_c0_g1_i1:143-517(-)
MGKTKDPKAATGGRQKEKLNYAVLFTKEQYKKVLSDVPKGRSITPSQVSDRFKVTVSLAKRLLREMHRQKLVKRVVIHNHMRIYASNVKQEVKTEVQQKGKGKGAEKKQQQKKGKQNEEEETDK